MSAAQRVPVIAGTLSFGALIGAVSTIPSLRNALSKFVPAHFWKYVALLFALLNLKNLPFMWHYRVLRGIFYHIYLSKTPLTAPHLFKPLITTSYNTILDCDYNLHKSNSTYFADLDVSRAHHVGSLLRTGLRRLNAGDTAGLPPNVVAAKEGSYIIALGAVACVFRKEIKPFEQFEIWTRCLCWDKKWLYIISHVVKAGSVKPKSWALQPWRRQRRGGGAKERTSEPAAEKTLQDVEAKDMTKNVFASSLAKYVCKKGRLTIAPEIALERSGLLPPRPEGVDGAVSAAATESPATTSTGEATPSSLTSPENLAAEVSVKLGGGEAERVAAPEQAGDDAQGMSWDEVERERLRGLKIAEHFDCMSAMHDEFGRDQDVLGKYPDFFW